MIQVSFTHYLLAVLVVVAAVSDVRRRRIPNWLTLGGVAAGLLTRTATDGWHGLAQASGGMLLGFGAYLALYSLRAMGAGDVKLMAAVGAITGPANWVYVFAASALVNAVFALALTIGKRRLRETLWNTADILYELMHLRPPYRQRSHLDVRDKRALSMPHAVAVAAGVAVCLLLARIR
jgi:prepilin peptidase CpaA